jgi:tRNA(fMet)-specific endonuclease VapC
MAYLIDTDIIVYSIKGNLKVQQRFREKEAIPKAISIITYGELLYGAKKSSQPEKNAAIVYRLAEIFPVVGITRSVIEAFAEIKRSLEIRGERLADLDLLIASTALSLNYTLVTNNTQHFQRIKGLKLENWIE